MRWEVEAGTMVTTPSIGLSRTLTERYLMVTEGANTSHPRVETAGCREARPERTVMSDETIYKLHYTILRNIITTTEDSRHCSSKTNTIHVISDKSMIPVISGKFM